MKLEKGTYNTGPSKYVFQIKIPLHFSFCILLHVNHLFINKPVFSNSVCNIINICESTIWFYTLMIYQHVIFLDFNENALTLKSFYLPCVQFTCLHCFHF